MLNFNTLYNFKITLLTNRQRRWKFCLEKNFRAKVITVLQVYE